MKIVDEFTGRILEGRRWSRGPPPGRRGQGGREDQGGEPDPRHDHAPELLPHVRQARRHDRHGRRPRPPSSTNTYDLQVVPIPTNRPMVRADQADLIYKTEDGQVRRRRRRHRRALRDRPAGARRHDLGREVREARRACSRSGASPTRCSTPSSTPGRPRSSPRPAACSAVTVATNMAGRGVDILLGGNPEGLAKRDVRAEGLDLEHRGGRRPRYEELARASSRPSTKAEGDKVRELGGLYVLGTERHERRRIDNQLRGRSGRQGDPGESRFYLVPRRRADAPVRHRRHELGDGQGPARRRAASRRRWSPRPSSGRRPPSSSATPRSARTSSSTTR